MSLPGEVVMASTSTQERPRYFRRANDERSVGGNEVINSKETPCKVGRLRTCSSAILVAGDKSFQSIISELKVSENCSKRGRRPSVCGRVLAFAIHEIPPTPFLRP